MNFKELIYNLQSINDELQQSAIRAVNTSLTLRNWLFGFYIVEFEQKKKEQNMEIFCFKGFLLR